MKTILAGIVAVMLALAPAASTFTVTDEDRGLSRMHPELVKDQT